MFLQIAKLLKLFPTKYSHIKANHDKNNLQKSPSPNATFHSAKNLSSISSLSYLAS